MGRPCSGPMGWLVEAKVSSIDLAVERAASKKISVRQLVWTSRRRRQRRFRLEFAHKHMIGAVLTSCWAIAARLQNARVTS